MEGKKAAYDIFLSSQHPRFIQKLMIKNNARLVDYLCRKYFPDESQIDFLEIGPGKGYLKQAVVDKGGGIRYHAVDRNENMLLNLGIRKDRVYVAQLPHLDCVQKKFDIIFVGYVIEHLKNGLELNDTIRSLKALLKKNGIVVLQFPDCMKMGMEFWNIDYTHIYPTTKRNVNMVLRDNGMHVDRNIDTNGLLYSWHIGSRLEYLLGRFLLFFYNYRLCHSICAWFYRKNIYDLDNFFYRAYGLFKEENTMFIAKADD